MFTPQDYLEEQLQKLVENSDLKKVAEMCEKDKKVKEAEAHYAKCEANNNLDPKT